MINILFRLNLIFFFKNEWIGSERFGVKSEYAGKENPRRKYGQSTQGNTICLFLKLEVLKLFCKIKKVKLEIILNLISLKNLQQSHKY